jgi:hypothetical protein
MPRRSGARILAVHSIEIRHGDPTLPKSGHMREAHEFEPIPVSAGRSCARCFCRGPHSDRTVEALTDLKTEVLYVIRFQSADGRSRKPHADLEQATIT